MDDYSIILFIIGSYLAFSILIAILASEKGRDGIWWFFFCLITTPIIGTIVVANLSDKKETLALHNKLDELIRILEQSNGNQSSIQQQSSTSYHCTSCGVDNEVGSNFCGNCGNQLS